MIQRQQRHGRIRRRSSQTTFCRNPLRQVNVDALFCLKRPGGFNDQVGIVRGYRGIIARQRDPGLVTNLETKLIAQGNALQDGNDLVISVRPLTENPQGPVDLGERRKLQQLYRVMNVCVRYTEPSGATNEPIAIARNSGDRMLARCFGDCIHLSTANAPGSS